MSKPRGHGLSKIPEYRIWAAMISRCERAKDPNYENYGGRGITVCPEWRADFTAFIADVGRRPTPDSTIDRIDNDKGYAPENVRWGSRKEQSRNRRGRLLVEVSGNLVPLSQACEILGVEYNLVQSRMKRGWTFKGASETPSFGKYGSRPENRIPR